MFLYRFFVGPVAALVIAAFLVSYWSDMDPMMAWFAGGFLVLMLLCSVMTVKHVRGLQVALRQEPEPCSIEVKSISGGRNNTSSYVAEMTVGDEVWRATLAANGFDRNCKGGPHAGRIWRHPVSKVPYAADINGTKLGIIPTVVKVNPDSLMERVIKLAHPEVS